MINFNISKNEIADILGINPFSEDKEYIGVSTIDNPNDQTIIFIKKITEELVPAISKLSQCLFVTQENAADINGEIIIVEKTRFAMAKILNYIGDKKNPYIKSISKTAVIHKGTKIGKNVRIEDFVFIGPNVVIGDNVRIKQGVKILENTTIGDYSIIRENSVIAGQGFGVEKDENGNNFKIMHFGGVVIGKYVEIGAFNTVVSGTINPTVIEDYVKTDDHVHIAHNCRIGENTTLTAGAIFGGSITTGRNVYVGLNSTVKNGAMVNDDNLVGMATAITKDIYLKNKTYTGVPGKEFDDFKNDKNAMKFLVENIGKIKKVLSNIE